MNSFIVYYSDTVMINFTPLECVCMCLQIDWCGVCWKIVMNLLVNSMKSNICQLQARKNISNLGVDSTESIKIFMLFHLTHVNRYNPSVKYHDGT